MNDNTPWAAVASPPLAPPTPITPDEEAMINAEFEGLLDDYQHTRRGDKSDLLRRVFAFARRVHGDDRRLSGVPYIVHPLAVARIVAHDMGLGSTSISAALLHDVVKTSRTSFDDLEAEFGPRITGLVRGLSRISGGRLRFVSDEADATHQHTPRDPKEQAENFRNLLLTISEDVRVILVKIADRLNNMRTLEALSEGKQRRIASETLYLYAPLADRLGLYHIKTELEDLSLRYEHPEDYATLKHQMQEAETNSALYFTTFAAPIKSLLDDLGLKYTFKYRMKSVYSVWRKMKTKHVGFDEVFDLFAARIVFEPSSAANEKIDCWRIYAAITSVYKIHPERLRDWISHPKPSGYEALQLTVMGPDNNWIEVQIRSTRMDQQAEDGVAAHWKYKRGDKGSNDAGLDKWLRNIREILDNPEPDAMSFLDSIKLNVLTRTIYVFTPTGELRELPKGATALDFAFSLHTRIGLHAEAARINHELSPLSAVLESSDQVEIITAESEKAVAEWLTFATTAKARSNISASLKKQRKQVSDAGEQMIRDFLAQGGVELNNDLMITFLNHYGVTQWDDLFYRFGSGELRIDDTFRRLARPKRHGSILGFLGSLTPRRKPHPQPAPAAPSPAEASATGGEQSHVLSTSSRGRRVSDIMNAIARSAKRTKKEEPVQTRTSTIELSGIDGHGLLNTITRVIGETCTASIINIHLECKEGLFKGYITLDTGDTQAIESMCAQLKKIHEVQKAVKL